LRQSAVHGLGRRVQALAGHVEHPAVERAAQAAVFAPPKREVGAAVRTVSVQQAVAVLLVTEQHQVFAQQPYRLYGALARQLVDQPPRAANTGA
jgi:hypothetical protein